LGYGFADACDGPSGIAAAEQLSPDLILLDVRMPGMDGIEVCRRLRVRPDLAAIPILMLTVLDRPNDAAAGIEAGANDFLSKPFAQVEFAARVRSLLRTKALQDRLVDVLGRYVSDSVAARVVRDPEGQRLGGDRRQVTTLFADVRGYTALASAHPPEAMIELLNLCLSVVTEPILEREGTVADLLGDGVFAFFGAPVAHENDSHRAVEAAVVIQRAIAGLVIPEVPGVRLQLGVGIATGTVIAGNIGSMRRMHYAVVGDSVQVAARLQTAAGPGQILIDKETYGAVKERARVQDIGTLRLAGKGDWVQTYNVIGLGEPTAEGPAPK
jgi:adenylate cyclase